MSHVEAGGGGSAILQYVKLTISLDYNMNLTQGHSAHLSFTLVVIHYLVIIDTITTCFWKDHRLKYSDYKVFQ